MKLIAIVTSVLLAPTVAFAAAATDITGLITILSGIITALIPFIIGLAMLFFLWGLAKYILSAGDEAGQAAARSMMIWGIIILFVMVSVWGLVNILSTSLIGSGAAPPVPTIPTG